MDWFDFFWHLRVRKLIKGGKKSKIKIISNKEIIQGMTLFEEI